MNRKQHIQNGLIVGSSALFATFAACDCPNDPAIDTNNVQEGEETLVGAECEPAQELSSCDLNNSNTVFCHPTQRVWVETFQEAAAFAQSPNNGTSNDETSDTSTGDTSGNTTPEQTTSNTTTPYTPDYPGNAEAVEHCRNGELYQPGDCGGVGYTGISNLQRRNTLPLRMLRTHNTP